MKTCRMCCSTVTLRRPSSHCTVKLSRPPPARPPPFSHCLSLLSSAQRGLTTRGFTTATASVAQTERRHAEILNTCTYTSIPSIQPICTDGNNPAFISHSHSKQVILLYVKEIKKKYPRRIKKIKLKRSDHSHSDGNKRHTGVLTCPAPGQLDHKAIGQVSLSV